VCAGARAGGRARARACLFNSTKIYRCEALFTRVNLAGVTAPAILGENPLRSIHKELSLNMVEQERLRRAKKLEEKKGKEV